MLWTIKFVMRKPLGFFEMYCILWVILTDHANCKLTLGSVPSAFIFTVVCNICSMLQAI